MSSRNTRSGSGAGGTRSPRGGGNVSKARRSKFAVGGDYPPEPQRRNRPSIEELGGRSEYRVRSASAVEEGDPMSSVGTRRTHGAPASEDITVDPEDLGRHFLKGAVQDERPLAADEDEEEEIEPTELLETTEEEQPPLPRERGIRPEEKLLTYYPDRTDREKEISERAQAEVGRRRRRARSP